MTRVLSAAIVAIVAVLAVFVPASTISFAQTEPGYTCDFSTLPQTFTCTESATSATSTPTAIPIPTPTSTPTAAVQATPTQSPTPAVTPTPIPTIPIVPTPTATLNAGGIPQCPDPGIYVWHGTVERNGAGAITCTYGHEHGDNPHQLDVTFGQMGTWWNGLAEHDISYPWETLDENESKHTAYKIIVRGSDALPLAPWYTINGQNYLEAFRGTYHLDGTKGFIMSQYHSFEFEAVICSPDANCGIARFGGVQDLGARLLTHDDPTAPGGILYACLFPNPNAPSGHQCDLIGPHSMAGGPSDSRTDETWYGSNNVYHPNPAGTGGHIVLDFGVIIGGVWSPVHDLSPLDAASPDPKIRGDYRPHYCCQPLISQNVDAWHHNTSVEISALGLQVSGFPVVNGRMTASGFTDRFGNAVAGCTIMAPDCVPFQLVNVPVGYEGYRDLEYHQDTGRPSQIVDYDVTDPATGLSLVAWPN